MRAPAVYRFISPDGRSYVGSVNDHRKRADACSAIAVRHNRASLARSAEARIELP
jgi:hypothetical protein